MGTPLRRCYWPDCVDIPVKEPSCPPKNQSCKASCGCTGHSNQPDQARRGFRVGGLAVVAVNWPVSWRGDQPLNTLPHGKIDAAPPPHWPGFNPLRERGIVSTVRYRPLNRTLRSGGRFLPAADWTLSPNFNWRAEAVCDADGAVPWMMFNRYLLTSAACLFERATRGWL